jgi:flagellar basal-body rod protein FlgC
MTTPIRGVPPLLEHAGAGGPQGRPMFRTLGISSSGLTAQRQRLEAIAGNIANAETTRTEDGTPYRRRVVRLEASPGNGVPAGGVAPLPAPFRLPALNPADSAHGVRVAAVEEDVTEGPLVYDPGHPDADPAGYVRMPNVRITDEMVDLMTARRVYEANATVFQSARSMLRRALEI